MLEKPDYGATRYALRGPGEGSKPYAIEQLVFTDQGETTFYDDGSLDFVTWAGSWMRVAELGTFATKEDARLFMVRRLAEPRMTDKEGSE